MEINLSRITEDVITQTDEYFESCFLGNLKLKKIIFRVLGRLLKEGSLNPVRKNPRSRLEPDSGAFAADFPIQLNY